MLLGLRAAASFEISVVCTLDPGGIACPPNSFVLRKPVKGYFCPSLPCRTIPRPLNSPFFSKSIKRGASFGAIITSVPSTVYNGFPVLILLIKLSNLPGLDSILAGERVTSAASVILNSS